MSNVPRHTRILFAALTATGMVAAGTGFVLGRATASSQLHGRQEPCSEAQSVYDASMQEATPGTRLGEEALRKAVIVVTQHPACFSVENRAEAQLYLDQHPTAKPRG